MIYIALILYEYSYFCFFFFFLLARTCLSHQRYWFFIISNNILSVNLWCWCLLSRTKLQEKFSIFFRETGPVKASSQRPWPCYGACMVYHRNPKELVILCALTTLPLHFHGAYNACTAISWSSYCTYGVLKTQWHLNERRSISMQKPRTTMAFAQQPLCMPAEPVELLLHCRRPYCAAMKTFKRPHWALFRTPSDSVCFQHAQSACHHSSFYGVPLHWSGGACNCTARTWAFCIFIGRRGITLRTLIWFDRGFTLTNSINLTPSNVVE